MKTDIKTEFSDYIIRCLFNEYGQHTDPEKVRRLWAEAETKDAFVSALKADPDLKFGQACGELAKNDFYFIRGLIGDRQFKTDSDAGSVLVFNDKFSVMIPNGYGDGISRVAVFDSRDEFNTNTLAYFTLIEGEFCISDYDCARIPIRTLNGRYNVYYGNGFVVFVKSEN